MDHLRKGKLAYPKGDLLRLLLAGGAAVAVVAMPDLAHAQDQSASPPAGDPLEQQDQSEKPAVPGRDIVVTGSRIVRKDFDSTSPIVTVDSKLLEQSGSISLEANLNKLPQFNPALTQFVTQDIQPGVNNTVGASTVSLRQLGANRNLVLIDGRRGTPINGTGVIDINSIPSAAIERVEIVTGGASSTYGADAVGGVVNFILKKNYQGVSLDAQASINQGGDGFEWRIAGLTGGNFADGRGNIMLGVEHYEREKVYRRNTEAYRRFWRDPGFNGDATFSQLTQNYLSSASFRNDADALNSIADALHLQHGDPRVAQVLATSPNWFFNDDGSIFVNTSQTLTDANGNAISYTPLAIGYTGALDGLFRKKTVQGLLTENTIDTLAQSPMRRWSAFAKSNFELDDDINFYTQFMFTSTHVESSFDITAALGNYAATIPHGTGLYAGSVLNFGTFQMTNPDFAPGGKYGLNCTTLAVGCTNSEVFPVSPEMAALLDARTDPNAPWTLNQYLKQFGNRRTENDNLSFQIVAGLNGKIPGTDWTWDVYGSHGETIAETALFGFGSIERYRAVVQAPNYGRNFSQTGNNGLTGGATATCTSGIDPFQAAAAWTADCKAAVGTDVRTENRVKQSVYEANLQGSLFALPYGNLRAAVGASYRENSIVNRGDSSATAGSSFLEGVNGVFPQGNTTGRITAKEAYGELLVPILADLPGARTLNLELGYRYSDYDPSGASHTWKINGEYAPVTWLHFRGGYQRSARSPNMGELFQATTTQVLFEFTGGDPCHPYSNQAYSANPTANPNAAAVRSICETQMGAGAAQYYASSGPGTYFPFLFGQGKQQGNPDLKPEVGKTWTVGAVLRSPWQSPWLSQTRLTIDYYNVEIDGAITAGTGQGTLRRCYDPIFNPSLDANNPICKLIDRDPNSGAINFIGITYSNAGQVKTAGIDVQFDWGVTLRDAGINVPGRFGVNVLVNYLDTFRTTDDVVAIPLTEYAGTLGGSGAGTSGPSYRWKSFATFSYGTPGASLSLQWQHLPKTASSIVPPVSDTYSYVGAPAYDLFNLSGTIAVTRDVSFRWGVDNLFNRMPPLANYDTMPAGPNEQPNIRTVNYFGNYNTIGRRFFIGASAKF